MEQTTVLTYPDWQKPLHEALLETDKSTLRDKIKVAEAAICRRQQAIAHSPSSHPERMAIQDALAMLRTLQMTELERP